MSVKLIGASVDRVEDPRLLTGRGRFVDDVVAPRMLHAAFLRSVVPHGRLDAIDTSAAMALPGVAAVLTAKDLAEVCASISQQGPPGLRTPVFTVLATDRVRFVGDPIAIVIADSRYLAEDACDLVELDITALPPLTSAEAALAPGAPRLYDDLADNYAYAAHFEYGDVAAMFSDAPRIIRHTFRQHRHAGVPMETRGGWPTTTRTRVSWSTGPPTKRLTRCACSCRACSASPSTGPPFCVATSAGPSGRRGRQAGRTWPCAPPA